MGRKYDYQKAKKLIQESVGLASASLGMAEDWFWTGETVWENGEFKKELDTPGLLLGGIDGSSWATPSLMLVFSDGVERLIACHDGGEQKGKPFVGAGMLGVLSGPAQANLPQLED